jgi:hypothetical protein
MFFIFSILPYNTKIISIICVSDTALKMNADLDPDQGEMLPNTF